MPKRDRIVDGNRSAVSGQFQDATLRLAPGQLANENCRSDGDNQFADWRSKSVWHLQLEQHMGCSVRLTLVFAGAIFFDVTYATASSPRWLS